MRLLGVEATWIGVGSFLAGLGALLSGWAAWRLSRHRKNGKKDD